VLSEDVLRFIRTAIRSVWALELLLLLRRDPARAWSVEALIRELRGSAGIVAGAMTELVAAGLVAAADDAFRYQPQSAELDALVGATAAAYAEYPVAVTQAIFTAPSDKIRLFADAFRLKKPE
jgi:hypothetical protein